MKKISLLGAGMVGTAMAVDLSKKFDVTAYDFSEKAVEKLNTKHNIKCIQSNLAEQENVWKAIEEADIVVNAVPGFMGFQTLKYIIEAKKNVVDISFFPEDAFELDEIAKKNNVIAIMDCGVAPGMSNILLGYHSKRMKVEDYKCYVGGLPFVKTHPFNYKAPFSPIDVIEEYVRPARFVKDGKEVVMPPLTDVEHLHFDEIGTLEAFNSDGLRSLIKTIDAPNMIEKTMRYPGTADGIIHLKQYGLFEDKEISVKGQNIKPIDLMAELLFDKWKLGEEEKEFTAMRIIVEGSENDKNVKYTYDLFDEFCEETKMSSMSRTTGYTCTAAVNLINDGLYDQKGISPPEFIGFKEGCTEYILKYLEERNVVYKLVKQ